MPGHVLQVQEQQQQQLTTFPKVEQAPSYLKHSIAGTMAGVSRVLVGQPFDIVKVRMQAQSKTTPLYSSSPDCLTKTVRNEGFFALYKGTTAPMLTVTLCASIQFAVNEECKSLLGKRKNPDESLSYSEYYLSGAIAGFVNSFIAGPTEHIRTRLQIQRNLAQQGVIEKGSKV